MKKLAILFILPICLFGASITSGHNDYLNLCKEAATNPTTFKTFRSSAPLLRAMGLGKNIGAACIPHIRTEYLTHIYKLDAYSQAGSPKKFDFENVGKFAPCTLRHLKVLSDLRELFGPLDEMRIVEIGGGFGGLCAILSTFEDKAHYTLIDLPPVLKLAQAFLNHLDIENVSFCNPDQLDQVQTPDLLISNYAFSEIDKQHQLEYLEKVISKSPRGYMIINFTSGIYKIKSYSLNELKKYFNDKGITLNITQEVPQSFPRRPNLLVSWGHECI